MTWFILGAPALCGSCGQTIPAKVAARRVASGLRCGDCARRLFGEVPCYDVVSPEIDDYERPWLKWLSKNTWSDAA